MNRTLRNLIGTQFVFFDGGTGTVLQGRGLKPGEFPETWNITHPDEIIDLHYRYYKAGANIVKTNTFGANSLKFPLSKTKDGSISRILNARFSLESVVKAAVANAKKARQQIESKSMTKEELAAERAAIQIPEAVSPQIRPHFIALDIGPCGKLLKPMGDLDFEDAVTLFKETISIGLDSGDIDAILIETMNDSYETKAAVLAAKEACTEAGGKYIGLPVFATTVYDESGKLLTGADPETMTAVLEGLGVDALGINCSLGPEQMKPIVSRLTAAASVPVIVNPNAGLPRSENGKTVYDVTATDFALIMEEIAAAGATMIGGCCGTTPEYICRLVNAVQNTKAKPITPKGTTVVASYTHTVRIGGGAAPVLIGERINPTGKKKFKQALRDKNLPYIIQQGLDQEANGAQILDVNVGLPEIDEKETMISVMTELQAVTALPLQIDTGTPSVMEAALRQYNGKALVNSVNGKTEIMTAVFPIVKKYGGVIVALTIDETGIPETAAGRIAIAKKIYRTAATYGIAKKDIIIDPLAMAISSDSTAAQATLETVRALHESGGNTILGVSNVSFGLPERELITSTFFTMALQNGLNAAIMNPGSKEMQKAYACFCALTGHDPQCLNYIDFAEKYAAAKSNVLPLPTMSVMTTTSSAKIHSNGSSASVSPQFPATEKGPAQNTLHYAIIHGLRETAGAYAKELLKTVPSLEIINHYLIPALDIVGKGFETKKIYLPQLLMSAEAAKSAFLVIKTELAKTGTTNKSRGTIIIATVKGDIHDIGKNIVKVLLENYDFTVIDLGKDVPPETIVNRCIKDHVPLVGLSALMTTTVPSMEETIKQLKAKAPWSKVCVGGAVMTQEYADMIHADFYGRDAMQTVTYAQQVFNQVKTTQ